MPDQWNAFVDGPRTALPATGSGVLDGLVFAVKDIIDVAGFPTGRGFLPPPGPALVSSPAVTALLEAGADCVGKTTTDQLAFGLSGGDTATPVPVNPRDPGAMTGGSSSGSAAAVAAGLVPIALSTDTAGSVRVPASYCGIVGFRPTWGAVAADGVTALAPRFDTVGWHARDARTAALVGRALLPAPAPGALASFTSVVVLEEGLRVTDPRAAGEIVAAAERTADRLGLPLRRWEWGIPLEAVGRVFRARQLIDIREVPRDPALLGRALPQVRARFEEAANARLDPRADAVVADALEVLRELLAEGALLVLPAAAGPAPRREDASSDSYARHRERTIALSAVGALLGAPVLVLPVDGGPVGVALHAAAGADRALLEHLAESAGPPVRTVRDELIGAFYAYEQALITDDRPALDRFFGDTAPCIRFAPEGVAFGRAAIAALRAGRPPAAAVRELTHIDVETIADDAGITAAQFLRPASGVRGCQSQTWRRIGGEWRICLAHVSVSS